MTTPAVDFRSGLRVALTEKTEAAASGMSTHARRQFAGAPEEVKQATRTAFNSGSLEHHANAAAIARKHGLHHLALHHLVSHRIGEAVVESAEKEGGELEAAADHASRAANSAHEDAFHASAHHHTGPEYDKQKAHAKELHGVAAGLHKEAYDHHKSREKDYGERWPQRTNMHHLKAAYHHAMIQHHEEHAKFKHLR